VATIRNAARERELARLKSDFVSTVSHELKTPLTSVRMFAEMLQQGVAKGDRSRESRYHEIIVKESERLGLLIANLLDYSQVERGTRRYSEQRVSMSELVKDSVSTFSRFQDEEQPSEIEVSDRSDGAAARVDREVIVQCVLNLLSNASKYGERKPIEVRVWSEAGEVGVSVRDRGPGIPRSEVGKIWDEFYRSPSAYSSGVEGTGLGLALVKRHVEAQGGRVEVESVTDEGSTFTIALPQVTARAEEAA
jgi:signal transduction histidine kinase